MSDNLGGDDAHKYLHGATAAKSDGASACVRYGSIERLLATGKISGEILQDKCNHLTVMKLCKALKTMYSTLTETHELQHTNIQEPMNGY